MLSAPTTSEHALLHQEEVDVFERTLANDERVVPCRLSRATVHAICGYDPTAISAVRSATVSPPH